MAAVSHGLAARANAGAHLFVDKLGGLVDFPGGVPRPCEDAELQNAQLAEQVDRVKAEDAKRLHTADSAVSGGGGESVAEYGERINSVNCVRADLGASIICNRN
jgi:hypothetical protein